MILCFSCAPAAAEVTCDQLGNISYATEQYRNQGESVQAILAEVDKLEASNNLSKQDMVRIRQTVQATFDRTHTPLDILKDCKDAAK